MAVPQIREFQVDSLLRDGELKIEGHYSWSESANKAWLKVEIPVKNSKSASLRLCMTVNRAFPDRCRFALLYNVTLRIRGLCVNGSHSNKHTNKDKWIGQTHVHKWKDNCQDRFAEESTIGGATPQDLLEAFCGECGIECLATLADIPSHTAEMLV